MMTMLTMPTTTMIVLGICHSSSSAQLSSHAASGLPPSLPPSLLVLLHLHLLHDQHDDIIIGLPLGLLHHLHHHHDDGNEYDDYQGKQFNDS